MVVDGNVSDSGRAHGTTKAKRWARRPDDRAIGTDREQSRREASALWIGDEDGRDGGYGVVVLVVVAVVDVAVSGQQAASSKPRRRCRRSEHGARVEAREGQLSSLKMRNTVKAQGESQ